MSVSQASAAGWTRSALRHAVETGTLVQPRRGWFAAADVALDRARLLAAAAAYSDGAISHRSSARLRRLPVLGAVPVHPEMTFAPRSTGNRRDVKQYRASLRPEDTCVLDGVLTTSAARMVVDVGRHAPLSTSVALLDAALQQNKVAIEDVHDVVDMCRNWSRIARARRAIALADGRAESPLESVSRLAMRWVGVPTPALQTEIFDQYGRFVARTDFFWDEFGVVGEADGRGKYDKPAVLIAEKDRQELLEELGLVVTRWQWEMPTRTPHAFKQQLERTFERGLDRRRAGLPKLWSL